VGYPTPEQKVDYLFKKIGFSASKTGVAEDQLTGFSGDTKKAPPNEAIPSPLVVPASSVWADTSYIPATPPTSSNGYVGVYSTATAYRMTVDTTVSNNRAFVARSTWGNHSSTIDGDWIDTQFGADYLIKVYKGDPSVGAPGVAYTNITAAGTGGGNDTWFFDYSSGVLNFNGADLTGQLVGIHTDNVYIVGYRYLGTKGVQPAAGIGTFHNLYVSGISTFVGNAYANSDVQVGGTLSVTGITTFNNDAHFVGAAGSILFDKSQNQLEFDDDVKVTFGDSNDLKIYHDLASDQSTIISNSKKISLMSGIGIEIEDEVGKQLADFTKGGASRLFYNANGDATDLKFETTNEGVLVSGVTTTARLDVTGVSTFRDKIDFKATSGISTAQWQPTSNRLAFYDNTKATFGSHADLNIYHTTASGGYSVISESGTGQLVIGGNIIEFKNEALNQTYASIDGSGIDVTGNTETDTLNVVGVSTFNDDVTFTGNSANVVWDKSANTLHFADNAVAEFGGGQDLQIHHNSSNNNSYITESGSGSLFIQGSDLYLTDENGTNMLYAANNAGVNLYHSGGVKLATTNTGINVTGVSTFSGAIDANGALDVDGQTDLDVLNVAESATFSADVQFTGQNYNAFWDKSVNSLQFSDNAKATWGDHAGAGDLQIYHNGFNSFIEESGTGALYIDTNHMYFRKAGTGDILAMFQSDASVALYHSASERFRTTGIGATVFGKTETQSLNVSGIATFSGTVSAASSTGVSGQVLQSTGVGVTWATQPQARSSATFTATEGQTGFSFNYNVNYLDVFVNGIKLTASEYTATNGTVVTLDTGCVVGDIVELYSYNIVSGTSGGGGGASILNDLNDVSITGTPVAGEQFQHNGTKFTNDYTLSTTTSSTGQTTLHSLSASTYRTVEWTIQATQGSNYHTTKILAVHNGSTVSHTEFATLIIGSSLATYTTDISGSNVRLLVTPSSNSNTAFKTKFTMIKV